MTIQDKHLVNGTAFGAELLASRGLALRQRAEAIFREQALQSPDAMRQMIHELRVHQIELELQNAELRRKSAYQHALLDSFPFAVWLKDTESRFLLVSTEFVRVFGAKDANELIGKNDFDIVPSDMAERYRADDRAVMASRQMKCVDEEIPTGGTRQWFETCKAPVIGERGEILGTLGVARNIHQRKCSEVALREQKEFFHSIAENIGDFIAVLDLEGRRLYNSPSYAQFFGAARELRGTDSFAEVHPEDQEHVKRVFTEAVQTGTGSQIEYRFVTADGTIRHIESQGSVIKDSAGRAARVVVVSHDITERRQLEEQVRQQALLDPLSQLPNRRLLSDRLSQAMAASKRSACYGALMFIDLDNFKPLNDTQGHEAGDCLLIEVAERLKKCVRAMDTVARFGGDEFVVILSELDVDKTESIAQAVFVAEKIRVGLAEPYLLSVNNERGAKIAVEHHCTASIGVSLFMNHDASQDDIIRWADKAMYQVKNTGRNSVRFYAPKD